MSGYTLTKDEDGWCLAGEDDPVYRLEVCYSKSSRARCRKCSENIDAKELRIGRPVKWRGFISSWTHTKCFWVEDGDEPVPEEEVYGFDQLREEDKNLVREVIKRLKIPDELEEVTPDDPGFGAKQDLPRVKPTNAMTVPLLPFQEEGYGWLRNQEKSLYGGGILADEMGMGKTIQTIALIAADKECITDSDDDEEESNNKGKGKRKKLKLGPTLVVCPSSAMLQWLDEIKRCTKEGHLRVLVYHGNVRSKLTPRDILSNDVILTTYPTLEYEYRQAMNRIKVPCQYCKRKFLPRKLGPHNKFFCGPNSQRSKKLAKTERSRAIATEKAMVTLKIKKDSPPKKARHSIPTPANIYRDLMAEAKRVPVSMYVSREKAKEIQSQARLRNEAVVEEPNQKLADEKPKIDWSQDEPETGFPLALWVYKQGQVFFWKMKNEWKTNLRTEDDDQTDAKVRASLFRFKQVSSTKEEVVLKNIGKDRSFFLKLGASTCELSADDQETWKTWISDAKDAWIVPTSEARLDDDEDVRFAPVGTYVGNVVARTFNKDSILGVVSGYSKDTEAKDEKEKEDLWRILHWDGDSEDLDLKEMNKALKPASLNNVGKKCRPPPELCLYRKIDQLLSPDKAKTTKKSKNQKAKAKRNEEDSDDDSDFVFEKHGSKEDDEDSDEDDTPVADLVEPKFVPATWGPEDLLGKQLKSQRSSSSASVMKKRRKKSRKPKKTKSKGDEKGSSGASGKKGSDAKSPVKIESGSNGTKRIRVSKRMNKFVSSSSSNANSGSHGKQKRAAGESDPSSSESSHSSSSSDDESNSDSSDGVVAKATASSSNKTQVFWYAPEGNVVDDDGIDLGTSLLHCIGWHRIVLDEAHKIKDRVNSTAKSVLALRGNPEEKGAGTGSGGGRCFRWCLTGTPLQNRVGDLYSLVRFLRIDPYAFYFCGFKDCGCRSLHWSFGGEARRCERCGHPPMRHYSYFNKVIINPIKRVGYTGDGRKAMLALRDDLLRNLMLRRTKQERQKDIELPPLTVKTESLELTEHELDFYEAVYKNTRFKFDTFVRKGTLLHNYAHIFELLSRLRRAADHPYLVIHGGQGGSNEEENQKEVFPSKSTGSSDVCGICNFDIESLKECSIAQCRHTFHKDCIHELLGENKPHGSSSSSKHPEDVVLGKNGVVDGDSSSSSKSKAILKRKRGKTNPDDDSITTAPSCPICFQPLVVTMGLHGGNENGSSKSPKNGETSESVCVICLDRERDALLLPCGHLYTCTGCVKNLHHRMCPMCREPIQKVVRVEPGRQRSEHLEKTKQAEEERRAENARYASALVGRKSILQRINLKFFESSTKIDAVVKQVRLMMKIKLEQGEAPHKAIIFSQYTDMLDLIEWKLRVAQVKTVKLVGSMPMAERRAVLNAFKTKPEVCVILMSLKAGGEGLNLQEATHVMIIDPWWNPATEEQAYMRAHRIGQTRPVTATRFVTINTIEERMHELQEKKRLIFQGAVDGSAGALQQLTEEDLRFLFSR